MLSWQGEIPLYPIRAVATIKYLETYYIKVIAGQCLGLFGNVSIN